MAVSGADAGDDKAELERSERFRADMGRMRWKGGVGELQWANSQTKINCCPVLYSLWNEMQLAAKQKKSGESRWLAFTATSLLLHCHRNTYVLAIVGLRPVAY